MEQENYTILYPGNIDINFEDINFNDPKNIQKKYIIEMLMDNKYLLFQTSKINIHKISNSFIDIKLDITNKKCKQLYSFILNLDEHIINIICKNSLSWFGKNMPQDKIEEMFIPSIRVSQNKEQPILRTYFNNEEQIEIYNSNKDILNINDINKNNKCILLIQINGIIFHKTKCYIDWKIIQLKTFEEIKKLKDKKLKIKGYSIRDVQNNEETDNLFINIED